jgi:DNA repair protein RadD
LKLRDYQVKAVYDTRKAASKGSVILQLPTGGGKTVVAGDMIKRALAKGKRVAFLVPYISLIDQTWQSFLKQGIRDLGVIQADHMLYDPRAAVQVCSVDTLARRRIFPDADLVIVDEAHRRSSFINLWMQEKATFVGLTATPWAKGMAEHWDSLVVGETVRGLIDQGHLSDFKVFAPSSPDLKGVKLVAGEYHQGQLYSQVSNAKLVASIVDTWKEKSTQEKTILFAVNRAHAAELQASFIANGVNAGYIDALTKPDEREIIRQKFHSGEVSVVCNVGCLVAGVDWDVRTLILAAPTRSPIKYVQMVGRALRTAEGKEYALILDHSDTTQRLGFVTDIHQDGLDDGTPAPKEQREQQEKLPKPCPNCGALKTTAICTACGYKYVPTSHIETEEGELVEVRQPRFTPERREEIYSMFLYHSRAKGYKDGWAYHKTEEMTGEHPCKRMTPTEPDQKVKNYIKHLNIKNARKFSTKSSTAKRSLTTAH